MKPNSEIGTEPWHTRLTGEFWSPLEDRIAELLPIFALGHQDSNIRDLAESLFEKLFVCADYSKQT